MSSIVQAEGEIDVCLDLFLTRLGEFADSGAAMDMSVWTQWSVLMKRLPCPI